MTVLHVRGLRVEIGGRTVVDGLDLSVRAGECVAIVGESGAGKSVAVRALLGLAPRGAVVDADELVIDGVDARGIGERGWRGLRGDRIALVAQDALVSLDPLRRVGAEVVESAVIHRGPERSRERWSERASALLRRVAVPDAGRRARQYPHELSGGLRQRALIASALAGEPSVLIADEPTTALDATVQARVLGLLREIVDGGMGAVFVSHDLAAVRRVADRVVIIRSGRVVESGTVGDILTAPAHPYTAELVRAATVTPRISPAHTSDPVLRVTGLGKTYDVPALHDATFSVDRGRTLAVVGESGAGKTTLARLLVGAEAPDTGSISWHLPSGHRRRVHLVQQNPAGAFDPRWSIGRSLREALAAGGVMRPDRSARVLELLDEVGLPPDVARRRPSTLSGGQRQRAAIARGLAADPDVLVLDEPVSALDATVRARVLALLDDVQRARGLTLIVITHDLGVVRTIADDVVVLQHGRIVESGTVRTVFDRPSHPFTQELLGAS